MIRSYLKPLFKRYIGLFVSMVGVSMLSIALMVSFLTAMTNLTNELSSYRNEYGVTDGIIDTSLVERSVVRPMADLPEISDVDERLVTYGFVKKSDSRVITSRILSYNEDDSQYRRYIVEENRPATGVCLDVESMYAKNNGFKVGDTVQIGFYDMFIPCTIGAIVKTPESMYVRAEDYIWSDNIDFGYIYLNEKDLGDAFVEIGKKIEARIDADPEAKAIYEEWKSILGADLPDLTSITTDYVRQRANQILIRCAPGYTEQQAMDAAKAFLEGKTDIKSSKLGSQTPAALYIERALKQLWIASTFLPVFFYGVTLLIIVLFLNQIIKSMTAEIGTMVSIGIAPKDITGLLSVFALAISIASCILGFALGYGIMSFLVNTFMEIYTLPTISFGFVWYILLAAAALTFAIGQLAVIISSRQIYRITPKDAMVSNESKRKALGPRTQAFLEKLPMTMRIGTNSMLQNKRRFFVSTFSIFAAFTMIALTANFFVSKEELINQTTSTRMPYDVQTYITGELPEGFIQDLEGQTYVKEVEVVDFTYLLVNYGGKESYCQTMGIERNHGALVYIPDDSGRRSTNIEEAGIILPSPLCAELGIKKGDTVKIRDHDVLVTGISAQYANPTAYLSKAALTEIGMIKAPSLLCRVSDQIAYSNYLASAEVTSMSVFTDKLAKDFHIRLQGADTMIIMLIVFSFLMGFVILAIMGQNSLMEQKKPVSIMRAIGFGLARISNLWTIQSTSQLILSTIFAVPSSIGLSILLFNLASSSAQVYPFIFSPLVYGLSFLLILIILAGTHFLSIFTVARWNLADNTRSRE